MRIALTVGRFDRAGGIERVTVQLALAYIGLGHDVTVFCTGWDPAIGGGCRFVRVRAPERPAWLRTLVLPGATARELAKNPHFDLVHGQGTSTLSCDLLTFHSVHAAWLDISAAGGGVVGLAKRAYPFHLAAIAMERRQVREHRGMIHACSDAVRDEVIRYYDADPARVVALPWGIDLDEFQPAPSVRTGQRQRWLIPADAPLLLLVANELHRKGLRPILEAMALLDRPDLYLAVAGRADPTPYLGVVKSLGLGDRVRFLGHQMPAACYQAADLFVLPSTYEGWGLVVGEALACGVPVIASRFPGSVAMITPGVNGLLLDDPHDATALASAIDKALVPAVRRAMAVAARPSVEAYAWANVARGLIALGAR